MSSSRAILLLVPLLCVTWCRSGHAQRKPDYQWINVTTDAAYAPRDGAGALVFQGQMWLLGGWNPGDKVHFPRICNNEVWSSTDAMTWILEKPNTFLLDRFDPRTDWEGRHTAGYVVYKDKMWIVGGDVNQGHYHDDVWHSADGVHWYELPNTPWKPRHAASVFVYGDALWMVAGNNMEKDVWKLVRGPSRQTETRSVLQNRRQFVGHSLSGI